MTHRSARARLYPALALVALAVGACSGSDLEALHDQRLDDAVAAAGDGSPDIGAASPEGDSPGNSPGNSPGDSQGDPQGKSPENSPDGSPGSSPMPDGTLTPVAAEPNAYELVFRDEFNGLELDATRWNTALPWGPDVTINDDQQYYVDALGANDGTTSQVDRSPFSFDGEALTISATRLPDSPETAEGRRAADNGLDWVSGVLSSAGKFEFTYGYMEARVDLPAGRALWPSIWLLGAEAVALRPQLYVMERDGGRPDEVFYDYEYVDEEGNLRSPGQFAIAGEGLADGFHTIGVSWSPDEFLFYLDGMPRYRIVGNDVSRQDMYLAFPFAIGGTWTGKADATTPDPAHWTIDYVRVWQKRSPG